MKKLTTIIGNDITENMILNGFNSHRVNATSGFFEPAGDIFLTRIIAINAAAISKIVFKIIIANHGLLIILMATPSRLLYAARYGKKAT